MSIDTSPSFSVATMALVMIPGPTILTVNPNAFVAARAHTAFATPSRSRYLAVPEATCW